MTARAVEALLTAGSLLANIAFNWKQRPGYALTSDDVEMLAKMQRKWDEARAAMAEAEKAAGAVLTGERIEQLIEAHVGGHELTDDEHKSMQTFARSVAAALAAPHPEAREAQPVAVPQWQPIETAPKDGRTIIVARQMDAFGWVKGYARWEGVGHISGWISNGFDPVMSNLGLAHPTHWMPLPAAPGAAAPAAPQPAKGGES